MLLQFLRFFFKNFRITGAVTIGTIFGAIVGTFIFGKSLLLVLVCIFLSIGLLLTDSWWHGLFKK